MPLVQRGKYEIKIYTNEFYHFDDTDIIITG